MTPPLPSRRMQIERWAGRIAWIGLGMETVLWIVLSEASIDSLPLLLLTSATLILGTWLCVGVLVVRYRRLFSAWYGLAGLVAALVLVCWGRGVATSGGITSLLLMGTLGLVVALPTSMALLLWRRDVSVVLIGLVLIAFVWGSLLASVPYGGPIQVWLRYFTSPEKGQLWWFETLTCLLILVVPLGSVAFTIHLVRLVAKEFQGD